MPRASVGRPSNESSRRSIAAAAREYGEEALLTLANVMRNEDAPPGARIDAAAKLLDRGFGRATEHKQITSVNAALAELTDEQLENAIAVLRAASGPVNGTGAGANGKGGTGLPH